MRAKAYTASNGHAAQYNKERRHKKFKLRVRVWKLKEEQTCEEYKCMVRGKVEED